MMLYVISCVDKKDGQELRQSLRAEHIEYMIDNIDVQVFGGPLLDEENNTIGSLMCMECKAREDIDVFLSEEPYNKAGLFQRVDVYRCRQMVPEIEPGYIARELEREKLKDNI